MTTAGQAQIARDEACDAVFDEMTDLVLAYVAETGLLTPGDLRRAGRGDRHLHRLTGAHGFRGADRDRGWPDPGPAVAPARGARHPGRPGSCATRSPPPSPPCPPG